MKKTLLMLSLVSAASGVTLYEITSFNNNGTDSAVYWTPGITTINSYSGAEGSVSGTTDAQLVTLQTINADPTLAANTGTNIARFANDDSLTSGFAGTLVIDRGTDDHMQFGIDVTALTQAFDLTTFTFDALRATTGTTVRGYDLEYSVDGGAYVSLGGGNIANNRNDSLESFSVDLSGITTPASSLDFRFAATGGGIQVTNFAINADIVPEPTSAALLGLGGLALVTRRKRS